MNHLGRLWYLKDGSKIGGVTPTISIDTWIDEKHIEPDFVKMDIEEHEIDAIKGMERTIKTAWPKPYFMIEVHGAHSAKNTIVKMIRDWTTREPSGENSIFTTYIISITCQEMSR